MNFAKCNSPKFILKILLLVCAIGIVGCQSTKSKHSVNVTKASANAPVATIYVPQNWPVRIFDVDGEPGPNPAATMPDINLIGDPYMYNSTWSGVADITVPVGRHIVKAGCLKKKGDDKFFDGLFFKKLNLLPVYRYFDLLLKEGEVANFVLPIPVVRQMKAARTNLSSDCPVEVHGAKAKQISKDQAERILAAIRKDGLQAWKKIPPPEDGEMVIKANSFPKGYGNLKKGKKPKKAVVID